MTISEVLKEVSVVHNVVSHDTRVSLEFLNVENDDELKAYAKENELHIFSPDSERPYYWFLTYIDNIDVTIKGRPKKVKIIY